MDKHKLTDVEQFIKKFHEDKKQNKLDLSLDEDLSIAIMNLVSIEEHFFFTAEKTKKRKYFDLLKEVREMRKSLLKKIVKNQEGEIWCISKHLLASSMRLMEVGTKLLKEDRKDEAYDLFDNSYKLYTLFWALNLKLIDVGEIKELHGSALNKTDKNKSIFQKIGNIIDKTLDCCKE
ncbi:MAG: hypothetical protein CO124_02090 [Candidatus Huberarchaeum crystalense]|uniref:Uncharacterized protein n=1 Tax=Huberarchaeum crystalense TaxID=2014257 RepID=A0A2H9QRW8_HUBC1|nr:MAG: hypothetical protein CO124_02090 [Candidatus Huberarchaeum crystalense]